MKIRTVEYAGAITRRGESAPEPLPQIAFSGRSNVGKSSLINTILRRTRAKIAHVSATPGKTRALNFYRVNSRFFLVDLPGYGYARAPEDVRQAWRELIEWYLTEARELKGVVHLVDARHVPSEHDRVMVSLLGERQLPTLVVITKMDKLKRSQRGPALERILRELRVEEDQLLPFSSRTGEGREALLEALDDLLGEVEVDS